MDSIKYSTGEQNIITPEFQMIRLSEGYCPHKCPWCYEHIYAIPKQDYKLPEIVRNVVHISDMNIFASNNPIEKIKQFKDIKVNNKVVYVKLICGIDYRFLTQELAIALKESRFINIHIAWDRKYIDQYKIKDALNYLLKAGYSEISIFMLINHPFISYDECCAKLNLCKYWNVKVNDCCYDNQTSPNYFEIGWSIDQIKKFRKDVRQHNQIVMFKSDVEFMKKFNNVMNKKQITFG